MAGLLEEPPASLEAVRRRVLGAVHAVERETGLFLHRHLANVGEPERWVEVLEIICERLGRRVDQLDDYNDLHRILNKYRSRRGMTPYPEVAQLRRMVERAKLFEYIAFSLRNELVTAYNGRLKKYCLSLQPDAGGQELHAVTEYENRILEWKEQTRRRLETVDTLLDEYDGYKSPLREYIAHYRRVLVVMGDTCRALDTVCQPIKRWASMDASYAKKLQDEIATYNKRKMDLRDIIRQLEFDHEQNALRLRRRAFFDLKGERALRQMRDEKRTLKRREMECRENFDKADAEITRKKRDFEEVKSRFSNRKENSPALYNYLSGLIETLRDGIWKIEAKQDIIQKQLNAIKKQQYEKQKELDKLYCELDSSNNARNKVLDKLQKQEDDLRALRTETKTLDERIGALKRIREIKLHSDTVKKIHHFGYQPGILERKAELDTAFKIAAGDLGKDWAWLYRELPFKPVRDQNTRNLDIELIDRNQRHVSDGAVFPTLALKSLEKWKRLSTVASLPELLAVLRKIRRSGTINKIEQQMRVRSS